jgi:hypothetical protein
VTRITISDLSSSNEEKFIHNISAGETQHMYAGMQRLFGSSIYGDETPAAPATVSFNNTNPNMTQWMDKLELQLKDLRKQIGI